MRALSVFNFNNVPWGYVNVSLKTINIRRIILNKNEGYFLFIGNILNSLTIISV